MSSDNDYTIMRMEELEWTISRGHIDKSLISLIKLLNERGFITNFCCSGLYRDHRRSKKSRDRLSKNSKNSRRYIWNDISGYIAFDKYLSYEQELELEEIACSCHLVFEESPRDDVKSFYDFEKKEHFLISEKSHFLNGCTFRNEFPEVINCNDRRKVSHKFLDGLVEYKWDLLYDIIKGSG